MISKHLMVSCWLFCLAPALPVQADYLELDGIVAIVDDDVVLASELFSRIDTVRQQFAGAGQQLPPNDILVSQIMERLIIESIQLQYADRRGVQVDDETLTRAVMGFAAQNDLALEEFHPLMIKHGISNLEFRDQIRREMIISRLQRSLVNRRVAISDNDIDDLLSSPYYQQLLSDEFRVGHILLAIEDSASDETILRALNEANEIVQELRDGAEFAQMAVSKSAGARALEGGDLGWRRAGELPTLFAEEVLKLRPGETSEPIRSGSGFHIVKLLEQRGAGMERAQQTLVRHILVQPSEIQSESETEALIQRIHGKLDAGEDFAALAVEYSEDPGSALNGGDLGWSTIDQFVPEFADRMAMTATGEFSAPFRTTHGWHLLQVQERREQDMSEEARRNMALQILHKRRFDEELQKWLKEIRDDAFVEIRL
ncbi:MAG: peptidylprolyl isomerase [Gammaproteobacteria bacterium]|nr:peptidylprolyl isomerase [Gammaproteobacteria bacterium]